MSLKCWIVQGICWVWGQLDNLFYELGMSRSFIALYVLAFVDLPVMCLCGDCVKCGEEEEDA